MKLFFFKFIIFCSDKMRPMMGGNSGEENQGNDKVGKSFIYFVITFTT